MQPRFPRGRGLGSHRHQNLLAAPRQRADTPRSRLSPPSPAAGLCSWARRQRVLRPSRAPGRAPAAVIGAPAPRRPGSCQGFGSSLRRLLPGPRARAEECHGEWVNSARGHGTAGQAARPSRERGDRPAWRKGRGAKSRDTHAHTEDRHGHQPAKCLAGSVPRTWGAL